MMNSIDNSIRLGIRQNRDDFIIAAVLIIGLGFSAGAFAPLLFAMMAAGIVFEVRACKRVFYDSVYGRQGYFYMSLPVDVRQLVISKLYTASILSAGIIAMLVIGGVFYFWISFNSVTVFEIIDQLTAQLVLVVKMELVYVVPITLISWIIGIVAQMTVIFAAIVCYSSLPEKKHTGKIQGTYDNCRGSSGAVCRKTGRSPYRLWSSGKLNTPHNCRGGISGNCNGSALYRYISQGAGKILYGDMMNRKNIEYLKLNLSECAYGKY